MTGNYPSTDDTLPADPPCPNCNGEGYIIVWVYPWDGCLYDEVPCKFCNSRKDISDVGDESSMEDDFPF